MVRVLYPATLAALALVCCTNDSTAAGCPSPCPPGYAPALIRVSLPANAKLFVDDKPTTATGPKREFTSPPLPLGKEFYYTFRMEPAASGSSGGPSNVPTTEPKPPEGVEPEPADAVKPKPPPGADAGAKPGAVTKKVFVSGGKILDVDFNK